MRSHRASFYSKIDLHYIVILFLKHDGEAAVLPNNLYFLKRFYGHYPKFYGHQEKFYGRHTRYNACHVRFFLEFWTTSKVLWLLLKYNLFKKIYKKDSCNLWIGIIYFLNKFGMHRKGSRLGRHKYEIMHNNGN